MTLFAGISFDVLNPTSAPVNGPARVVFSDLLLILAAALALTLVLLLWAKYFRKSKSVGSRSVILSAPRETEDEEEEEHAGHSGHRHRRKRKRKKHDHRSRNPTLAETGGLPPMRGEGPPPPAS